MPNSGRRDINSACSYGDLDTVKELVGQGILILNSSFKNAFKNRHYKVCDFLIESGFDINLYSSSYPLLFYVIFDRNHEGAKFLINHGVNHHNYRYITFAYYNRDKEMIKLLVDAGADINRFNVYSMNIFDTAMVRNDYEMADFLYSLGGRPNWSTYFTFYQIYRIKRFFDKIGKAGKQ